MYNTYFIDYEENVRVGQLVRLVYNKTLTIEDNSAIRKFFRDKVWYRNPIFMNYGHDEKIFVIKDQFSKHHWYVPESAIVKDYVKDFEYLFSMTFKVQAGEKIEDIDKRIQYLALGLAGEAGELLGKIAKIIRDKDGHISEYDYDEIHKELADCYYMLNGLSLLLYTSPQSAHFLLFEKLVSRYYRNKISGSGDNR